MSPEPRCDEGTEARLKHFSVLTRVQWKPMHKTNGIWSAHLQGT